VRPGEEIHHLLTRGRGGGALDAVGETYHLAHLCRIHHRSADGALAYSAGLLIDGFCIYDRILARPVYRGSDEWLTEHYGPEQVDQGHEDEPAGDAAA
jgi:hypothetical protein